MYVWMPNPEDNNRAAVEAQNSACNKAQLDKEQINQVLGCTTTNPVGSQEMTILQRIEALETHVKDELYSIRKEMIENVKYAVDWREYGDGYWYLSAEGIPVEAMCRHYICDTMRFELGNCFKTKQEAEHKAARDRAVAEWNRLAGPQDWVDWNNTDVSKKYPSYNYETNTAWVYFAVQKKAWPYAHFKTEEECQAAIDKMGTDKMKLLFGGA